MGQQPPPEVQDFHLRDALNVEQHLLQLDGELGAVFLPQGYLDIREVTDNPELPPAGRLRIFTIGGALATLQNDGTLRPVSRGTSRLVSMPSACRFIDGPGAPPDDGKQTARSYEGLGLIFLEGYQNEGAAGPGDPGMESDGLGGLTAFIVMSANDDNSGTSIPRFTLAIPFPSDFVSWGDDGIRWKTRLVSASGPGGSIDITAEVFDPLAGASFSTPIVASRNVDDTDAPETAYGITQITKAQLDAELERFESAKGTGLLAMQFSLAPPSVGGGERYVFNLGAIDIDWLRA